MKMKTMKSSLVMAMIRKKNNPTLTIIWITNKDTSKEVKEEEEIMIDVRYTH